MNDAAGDPDTDGLTNLQEYGYGTHPNLADTDADGMPDPWEIQHGLNPLASDPSLDTDTDGLTNLQEYQAGTDPRDADSDDDTLSDYQEVMVYGTNPLLADTDADGLPDAWELDRGLNPLVNDAAGDPDTDGLTNLQEYGYGTQPNLADTDADGLNDYQELLVQHTDPLRADTDGDGLPDGWEVAYAFNPLSDGGLGYGLTAHWTFDEGAGTVASNRTGSGWNGVLQGMTAANWVAGRAGGALWFDGVNDCVAVSQAAGAVVTGAPFTVMATVWREGAGAKLFPSVLSDGKWFSGSRWPGYLLRYDRAADWMNAHAGTSNQLFYVMAVTNWSARYDGQWVDLAITHDGTRARLYVNGVETHSRTTGFDAVRNDELYIGRGHVDPAESWWSGRIDDVRIFRAALGTHALGEVNEWIGDADGDRLTNGEEYEAGTDPRDADSDDDTLSDYDEVKVRLTDPLSSDTDADGLPDAWEAAKGTNPLVGDAADDPDLDGLTNLQEYQAGTDPRDADSDDDTLSDYQEVIVHGTNPLSADTDADGLPDAWELDRGLNPLVNDAAGDPDTDGLTNLQEYGYGTHPNLADTDADGMPDPWEILHGLNPLASDPSLDTDTDGLTNLQEYQAGTDPRDADSDDDTLSDYQEVMVYGTNPLLADTDADGLPDAWEVAMGLNPLSDIGDDGSDGDPDSDDLTNAQEHALGTHPLQSDSDNDGLTDSTEIYTTGTDPLRADTDGDELPDGWEQQYGLDPLSGMRPEQRLACWLKFDEETGTNVVNSVPGGMAPRAYGFAAADRIAGMHGGAARFNGTNSYISISQIPVPVVTASAFTVTAWIRQESLPMRPYPTLISDCRWLGGQYWPGFHLRVQTNENQMTWSVGHETQQAVKARAGRWIEERTGQWVHVAAVYDGAMARLYVNGVKTDEQATPFSRGDNNELWIGRGHVNTPDSWWRGAVDDLRVYNRDLTVSELYSLFDAQADMNGDGVSNLDAFRNGLDPRLPEGPTGSEGALDIQFVPGAWSTNEPLQYLAYFNDSNPGQEIHLFLQDDALNFVLYDATGTRHSIRHKRLVGDGYLLPGRINRVTAAWRGFTGATNGAEMRLFVNGLDRQSSAGHVTTPRLTEYNWDSGDWYYNASYITAPLTTVVDSNRTLFGAGPGSLYPLQGTVIEFRVRTEPYGMVATNPAAPFGGGVFSAPDPGPRPRTLLQGITRPRTLPEYVSTNEMRTLIRRYRQVTDSVEYEISWLGWAKLSPTVWDIMEENLATAIRIGNQEGLDIAMSSWNRLDAKVCWQYSNSISAWAENLRVDASGGQGRVTLTNTAWYGDGTYLASQVDLGHRESVTQYLAVWRANLSAFSNYTHFFFNEDALLPGGSPYLLSPTYSSHSLAWFREYTSAKYGPAYSQIRFPVSPVPIRMATDTNPPPFSQLVLDDSVTNRLELTTDPDHWAKWWEWRTVVFANLMAGYVQHLEELNASNPYWRGAIYFISPSAPWSLNAGVDLHLLARIPGLQWMVMENGRSQTYGTAPERLEEEIRLQLEYLKNITGTNSGFGSYAMAHTYSYPRIENGVTTFTYNIGWLTQDVGHAVSPAFRSQMVVPYSAALLVNWPGFTSDYQRATYVPEVADAWLRERFSRLWTPIDYHYPDGGTTSYVSVFFHWSYIDQSAGYEWELSTSPTFAITNQGAATMMPYHSHSLLTDPLPVRQELYWRARSLFHVYSFSEDGQVTGTNVYHGAWSACPGPIVIQDDDLDGLPDAWESYYFGHLDGDGDDDPDGDTVPNSVEYAEATHPGGYGLVSP